MTDPTWASARDAAARHHAENWTEPRMLSEAAVDALAHAYEKGADFGRASLLADLEASLARERGLREALENAERSLESLANVTVITVTPRELPVSIINGPADIAREVIAAIRAALAAGKTCEGEK